MITAGLRLDAGDRGSVAAELAVALPVVVLTLLLGVGTLGAASRQVALQDAVADVARIIARGESPETVSSASGPPGATFATSHRGELVCVTGRIELEVGRIIRFPLSASSCALSGGR